MAAHNSLYLQDMIALHRHTCRLNTNANKINLSQRMGRNPKLRKKQSSNNLGVGCLFRYSRKPEHVYPLVLKVRAAVSCWVCTLDTELGSSSRAVCTVIDHSSHEKESDCQRGWAFTRQSTVWRIGLSTDETVKRLDFLYVSNSFANVPALT